MIAFLSGFVLGFIAGAVALFLFFNELFRGRR